MGQNRVTIRNPSDQSGANVTAPKRKRKNNVNMRDWLGGHKIEDQEDGLMKHHPVRAQTDREKPSLEKKRCCGAVSDTKNIKEGSSKGEKFGSCPKRGVRPRNIYRRDQQPFQRRKRALVDSQTTPAPDHNRKNEPILICAKGFRA